MDSGDDQSCYTAFERLLLARCERAFSPVSAQAGDHATAHSSGNCINSAHCPTGTVQYVCQGHHGTFISYTAPKTSFGIPWRAKQIQRPAVSGLVMINLIASSLIVYLPAETTLENLNGTFRLDCVFCFFVCFFVVVFFLFPNTILNLGEHATTHLTKLLFRALTSLL